MPVKKNNKKNTEQKEISKKKKSSTKKKVKGSSKTNKGKETKKKNVKSTKKHVDNDLIDIKKAVKDLPTILAQEMRQQTDISKNDVTYKVDVEKEKIIPVKHNNSAEIYKSPKNSQRWLWSAVILFTIVIFSLWLLNISNIFYDSKGNGGPLDSLKDSQKELKNIFGNFDNKIKSSVTSTSGVEEKDVLQEETNEKIHEAMESLFQVTTVTSSTIEMSTSTTSTINN